MIFIKITRSSLRCYKFEKFPGGAVTINNLFVIKSFVLIIARAYQAPEGGKSACMHACNACNLDVTRNRFLDYPWNCVDALYARYFRDPMKNKGYHSPLTLKCFKQNRESSALVAQPVSTGSQTITTQQGRLKQSQLLVYLFKNSNLERRLLTSWFRSHWKWTVWGSIAG